MLSHTNGINRIRDTIEIILIFNYLDGSIVLFCCLYKCYNAFLKTIECHICDDRIRIRDWKNKSSSNGHRKHCSENNKEFLKNLPEPFDVRCPTCFNYLKLLPKVIFLNRMSITAFLKYWDICCKSMDLFLVSFFISGYMNLRNAGKHFDVMISTVHFPKKHSLTV